MTTAAMTERQRILLETATVRDRAEALLKGLIETKSTFERHTPAASKPDALKKVTGRSSIDNAVASTQRMVEALNRTLGQLRRELNDEDLALIEDVPAKA